MSENQSKPFEWIPGDGIDQESVNRMKDVFPRPDEPMGEAWFLGDDRKMYDNLIEEDLSLVPVEELFKVQGEITSGLSCHGPLEEWIDWYHHLLAFTINRFSEEVCSNSYHETLISSFMVLHQVQIENSHYTTYPESYRKDILDTLGTAIMDQAVWQDGEIRPDTFLDYTGEGLPMIRGGFTASMYFCLKYLEPEQLFDWFRSAAAIKDIHWQAKLMCWLIALQEFVTGEVKQPKDLDYPISWEYAYHLTGFNIDIYPKYRKIQQFPFLTSERISAFLDILPGIITRDWFYETMSKISEDEDLKADLLGVPDIFRETYMES